MKIHRNLIWIRSRPELLDHLAADPRLSRFILARPAPDLVAIRQAAQAEVTARLEKLGFIPRVAGGVG